ncbi:hypothetical protein Hanom_Chr05g00455981 [Helianthus anomalus]
MDETVQRGILAVGVPTANNCERIQTVIRRLERKFLADDDDDDTDLQTVTSWSLVEQSRTVKVTYQHGVDYSLTMDEVLNTDRLHLEQLCDLAPSNDATSRVVMIFKYRMRES